MSFDIKTFNPADVMFSLGGATIVGWNSISIKRDSPPFTVKKGIRGKHTRIRSYDTSATITISLPQISDWNDVFSSIVTQDTESATGRCEIMLQDYSGSSLFSSTQAYVVDYAETTFDSSIQARAWTIQCLTTDNYFVGGASSPSTNLFDSAIRNISDFFS